MADQMKPTPRSPILGLFSDIVNLPLQYMSEPQRTQQMQGVAQFFYDTGIPKTLERASYGEPLFSGAGMTLRPKEETINAAMNVAPFAPAMGRVAGRTGRAVGRMAGEEISAAMSGLPTRSLLGEITPKPKLLDVYHGTPHTLPPTERNPLGEFDASKIGTGEGAQSFGYGIYTAENPLVAKDYQFMEQNWFDTSKAKYKGKSIDSWYEQAQKDQERAFRTKNKALEEDATARLAYWENIMTHNHPEKVLQQFTDPEYGWDAATKYAKSIDLSKFEGIPRSGNLYKVDLPDEKIATMLDWDKPLSQQSPQVQAAIEKLTGIKADKAKLNEFDDALLNALQGGTTELPKQPLDPLGSDLYQRIIGGNPVQVAEKLQEQGIAGIKYLDQFSREAGQGTRNFVIFPKEEKSMTILERNGVRAFPQEFTYPQQAALDLAQQRAALPVSEGGLGLPPNNTAMDRAKAMGFESGYVHGSPNPNITNLKPSITGAQGEGIYATNYLPEANMYSGTKEGATNYPLYVKTQKALDVGEADPYDVLGFDLQGQLSQRQKDAIISKQKETEDWLIRNGVPFMPSREHYVSTLPENFRSRFAAFDPFRKDVATATAMGVALPDLLAQPVNQYRPTYEPIPTYTDPFGNTIDFSIR